MWTSKWSPACFSGCGKPCTLWPSWKGANSRGARIGRSLFGGRRKGKRGRAAVGKSVVFGLLEREHCVYTKVVESVSAEELMRHIQAINRKGSVYYTDAFRGYQSLKRYGKHHTINHVKHFLNRTRVKNHINGIEGWSYAKHILYQYRGVSKYHFSDVPQGNRIPI